MLTASTTDRLLIVYEAMAAAARQNDWDALARLGDEARLLREDAQRRGGTPAALATEEQQRIATAIHRIAELDREIRVHAEPALESSRKLLSSTVQNRNLRNAYGA